MIDGGVELLSSFCHYERASVGGYMSHSHAEMQAEDHMTPVNHSLLTSHEL